MGRQLNRVPLDFQWPLNKPWIGYINPHYVAVNCTCCNGTGESPHAKYFKDQWYGYAPFDPHETGSAPFTHAHPAVVAFASRSVGRDPGYYGTGRNAVTLEAVRLSRMWDAQWSHHLSQSDVDALIAAGRLMDFTHTWAKGEGWTRKEPAYNPTAAEVNVWSLQGFGHDSINQWVCVKARCAALGVGSECSNCHGEGIFWPSPEAKQRFEDWTHEVLPTGHGYQIWETVSEGSPITPVFSTPEELAKYAASHPWGADSETTYDQWLEWIKGPGWAMSLAVTDGQVVSGVVAAIS